MKKLLYYAGLMMAVIILLPLLIVKGCEYKVEEPLEQPDILTGKEITVYNHTTAENMKMELEEYIKGVLAAEMPADFDLEALKAQALAARTFAFGRMIHEYESKKGYHDDTELCTDFSHCQAWMSREVAMKKWGVFNASKNWNKISKAVNETRDLIIIHDGEVINALFHANSGGRTENCEEVWAGVAEPYLRSVESIGEDIAKDFQVSVTFKATDFIDRIKSQFQDLKLNAKNLVSNIKILEYSEGERVKTIKIGNITMKGTELRTILGLRSTKFKIEKAENDSVKITTLGYGHGVGLSQWGANYLAKRGGTFDEIVRYYYTGVQVISIDDYIQSVKN